MTTSSTFCRANASRPATSGASDVSASRSSGTCSSEQDVLTVSSPTRPSSDAQSDSTAGMSARHTFRPSTTPATSVFPPIPPTAPSASRFPGPATKSRPIASTGLSLSTASASPISPK